MVGLFRRCWKVGIAGLLGLWLLAATPASGIVCVFACPFCAMQGQTLTGEVSQASMVLYGTLKDADMTPKDNAPDGTTKMVIETVVKNHDFLNGRKEITLPRYVPATSDNSRGKFLVFCDIFKNNLDPYRGIEVKANSDMPKYLKGALELASAKVEKRLRFFFDYLDNEDVEISNDAYKEFANADYKDYRDMAKLLPADKVAGWLKDPKTPSFRYGLYASILGHCGKPEHAELLRSMLEKPEVRLGSGVDGLLAGYTMLKPKEGLKYLKEILADSSHEFLYRYSALKAVRFFWDYRTDVLGHKELAEAITPLLHVKDIADLAIDDFRKWQCWDMSGKILELRNSPVYGTSVVKRSIIKFALSNKQDEQCQLFITTLRMKEPKLVNDVEELLKLEPVPVPTPNPAK